MSGLSGIIKGNASYFCATPKNHQLCLPHENIKKALSTKKVIVCFYNLGEENSSFCNISNYHIDFVWNSSKVQRSLFQRIARFL